MMRVRVFIENEAHSTRKHHHDERALTFQRAETVSRAYPFPYGFVMGTTNADGDCLDCYVITERALRTGDIVECEAIGLMEQTEDGLTDDNVLARLVDEPWGVTAVVQQTLTDFVQNVFRHIPGRTIGVGQFFGPEHAERAIDSSRDQIQIREEPVTALSEHAQIPIAFTVSQIVDVSRRADGAFQLTERAIERPYVKDYDVVESPAQWVDRFDLSDWGLLSAYQGAWRAGGAVIARNTPALALLEGRTDLALLWDLRVHPKVRGHGIGTLLFRTAEQWALNRGCSEMRIETQNVNVGACRFYERQGCTLRGANPSMYDRFPHEVQLLWQKHLSRA
jgi:inorganic pyrophosphatase/GNAT superfamily N-acetyltransferase